MLALFLFLFFMLLGLTKGRNYPNFSISPWMKTTVLYGTSIVFIALILPKGGALLSWPWLEHQLGSQFPEIFAWRKDMVYSRAFGGDQPFDFAMTGFQPAGKPLGGPVSLKEDLVMAVEAPYPLYLRGNVKTIYRDNQWMNSEEPGQIFKPGDWLPGENQQGSQVQLTITHGHFATGTLFSPYQPLRISGISGGSLQVGQDQQLLLRGSAIYRKESYRVLAWISREMKAEEGAVTYPGELSPYWHLPVGLDQRIYQLGNTITKGMASPYEKAKAIEKYLREHYQYTLTPDWVPEGKEFVSYFLFESQEGYCTYFATAMVVLLRTQGIPARYVEGYRLPQESQGGVYQVLGTNAHAWVEAHMGPGGWVTFEPTPAFRILETEAATSRTGAQDGGEGVSFDEMEALLQWVLEQEEIEGQVASDLIVGSRSEVTDAVDNRDWSMEALMLKILGILLYGLLIGVIPLRIFYCILQYVRGVNRLKETKNNGRVQQLYWQTLHLLSLMNYGIQRGETPREYARRIHHHIYDRTLDFRQITEAYVMVQYSGEGTREGVALELWTLIWRLDKKLRIRLGLFSYLWMKYFQGRWMYYIPFKSWL